MYIGGTNSKRFCLLLLYALPDGLTVALTYEACVADARTKSITIYVERQQSTNVRNVNLQSTCEYFVVILILHCRQFTAAVRKKYFSLWFRCVCYLFQVIASCVGAVSILTYIPCFFTNQFGEIRQCGVSGTRIGLSLMKQ